MPEEDKSLVYKCTPGPPSQTSWPTRPCCLKQRYPSRSKAPPISLPISWERTQLLSPTNDLSQTGMLPEHTSVTSGLTLFPGVFPLWDDFPSPLFQASLPPQRPLPRPSPPFLFHEALPTLSGRAHRSLLCVTTKPGASCVSVPSPYTGTPFLSLPPAKRKSPEDTARLTRRGLSLVLL